MDENSPMTPMDNALTKLREALSSAKHVQELVRNRLSPVLIPRDTPPTGECVAKNPRPLTAPVVNDIIVIAEELDVITNTYGEILGQLEI